MTSPAGIASRAIALVALLAATDAARGQVCGDPDGNGRIDVVDAANVARAAVGLPSACDGAPEVCDVDGAGGIDVLDAANVARAAVGLPAASACKAWNLAKPAPGVEPEAGCYAFNRRGCAFVDDADGRKRLGFAVDCASPAPDTPCTGPCFRFDLVPIEQGAFFNTHGEIAGTDCPTDAYAVSGSFVTPGRAEGTIKYGFDCRVIAEESFVLTRSDPPGGGCVLPP
jgi:hypothetical protein